MDRVQDASASGWQVDVLGIDPSNFGQVAFWDSRFADASLPTLLARLTQRDAASTALAVGLPATNTVQLSVTPTGPPIVVGVVAALRAFPGERGNPLLVVDQRVLAKLQLASAQVWMRGDVSSNEALLRRAGLDVRYVVTAGQVSAAPNLLAIRWTFDFLDALGVLAGVIAVSGLLIYLPTRQRQRRLAYLFARRMGLSKVSHLRSLLLETGTTLTAGYLLGGLLSLAATGAVYRQLDPDPLVPPAPLYVAPYVALWSSAAVAALVVVVTPLAAQRATDRGSRAELLRLTE